MKTLKVTTVIEKKKEYTEDDVKRDVCIQCCGFGTVVVTLFINSEQKAKYVVDCPNCHGSGKSNFVSNFLSSQISTKEVIINLD